MGIAAYNRTNKVFAAQFAAEVQACNNKQDDRARLWAAAMEAGMVLQFKVDGDVITCGPNQMAIGPSEFMTIRYGKSRFAGEYESRSAWDVALRVVQHTGRKRPFNAEVDTAY